MLHFCKTHKTMKINAQPTNGTNALSEVSQSTKSFSFSLISDEQLTLFAKQIVAEMLGNQQEPAEPADEYLTAKQTAKKFKVSVSTIDRWQQSGYLVPNRAGRKRLYKVTDVEQLINGTK